MYMILVTKYIFLYLIKIVIFLIHDFNMLGIKICIVLICHINLFCHFIDSSFSGPTQASPYADMDMIWCLFFSRSFYTDAFIGRSNVAIQRKEVESILPVQRRNICIGNPDWSGKKHAV